jgi:hypothetical protein
MMLKIAGLLAASATTVLIALPAAPAQAHDRAAKAVRNSTATVQDISSQRRYSRTVVYSSGPRYVTRRAYRSYGWGGGPAFYAGVGGLGAGYYASSYGYGEPAYAYGWDEPYYDAYAYAPGPAVGVSVGPVSVGFGTGYGYNGWGGGYGYGPAYGWGW